MGRKAGDSMDHSEFVQSIRRMAPFRSAQQDTDVYDAAASARALRQAVENSQRTARYTGLADRLRGPQLPGRELEGL